ncbi:MAG: thiamine phosphate synthase [Candidatus Rokubacteria bacterium]|nr:thiamine phosphate synthase [Candidatus Rokubacteria bacterium]
MARVDFRLYLVTDRRQVPERGLLESLEAALAAGVPAVQLREKDLTGRELYRLAIEVRELTRRHGARLLVNDRLDVALAVEADGAHLPSDSFPVAEARRLLGPDRLIGVSTHSAVEAVEAQAEGADFVVLGPIYDTPSKRPFGSPLGPGVLRAARAEIAIPIFAIGGVTAANAPEVLAAGADGVAVISAILAAPDPKEAARALLAVLGGAR